MRNDLAFAYAAIEWAESNLPPFQYRMDEWLRNNMSVAIREIAFNATDDLAVAVEKQPFPLSFSVEFGAYINAIRSSLDIASVAVAQRFGITDLDKVYFPVAKSEAEFRAGTAKGMKQIRKLPPRELSIFESLHPYKGGNADIWALHKMDIERKHKRLLNVEASVYEFAITNPLSWMQFPERLETAFTPIFHHISANGETPFCFVPKGTQPSYLHPSYVVAVDEPELPFRSQAGITLNKFCLLARSIVERFE